MQQSPFCNKNCVNFGIKLDADISIWMQSGFDGFDFSATLLTTHPSILGGKVQRTHEPEGLGCKILLRFGLIKNGPHILTHVDIHSIYIFRLKL